jgi:hypothetical protein
MHQEFAGGCWHHGADERRMLKVCPLLLPLLLLLPQETLKMMMRRCLQQGSPAAAAEVAGQVQEPGAGVAGEAAPLGMQVWGQHQAEGVQLQACMGLLQQQQGLGAREMC